MWWSSGGWRARRRASGIEGGSVALHQCARLFIVTALRGPCHLEAGRVAAWLLLVCLLLAPAVSAQTLDDRVYAVARQLMCPVCQGQTVAESDSTLAAEMKTIIRQKLEAGETPDQILRYFVDQFGDGVLAEPRPRGAGFLLYLAPPLALAAGVAIAAAAIRRWRARTVLLDSGPNAHPVLPAAEARPPSPSE
jgi:cytochrome c-type biogenesis protein CcmH